MVPRHRILEHLAHIDDPSVDEALVDAMHVATDDDLAYLVPTALQRRCPVSTLELIHLFQHLDAKHQSAVASAAAEQGKPLREACRQDNLTTVLNSIEIIASTRRTDLTYLLAGLLRHVDRRVRHAAGRCLLRLAATTRRRAENAAQPDDGEPDRQFTAVVDRLLHRFDHGDEEAVITAAMASLPHPSPGAFAALGQWHHPAITTLRQRLVCPRSRTTRAVLPILLRRAPLRDAALEGIQWARDEDQLTDVIAQAHLLTLRPARDALAGCCVDDPFGRSALNLPPASARGAARWLQTIHVDREEQVRLLAALHDHPDALARISSLRRLIELAATSGEDPAWEGVARFCRDTETSIGRVALSALCRADWNGLPRWLPRLLHNTPDQVRTHAAQLMSREGFNLLWKAWPALDDERRAAAARAVLKIDTGFHVALGRRIVSDRRTDVLLALDIVETTNQTTFFSDSLVALAASADVHIASRAVKVLAGSQSPKALTALDRSLDHPDGRVRANAVESLVTHQLARHADRLGVMARQEENRPQANAIRALLGHAPDAGREALLSMLRDIRPPHRGSALWVIGVEGLTDMSSRVAEMSVSDAAPEVRQRATHVVDGLIQLMHRKPPTAALAVPAISM